ncbi:MAG: recombination mediator RecR [bacterium]
MYNYPHKLLKLINEVSKLPGVGPKMAERIGLHIIKKEYEYIDNFSSVLQESKGLTYCKECFNVSDFDLCAICADGDRDKKLLCVVESAEEVITVERTGKYNGYYHVLQGLINPLNNLLPDNLRIKELLDRLKNKKGLVQEIILAINHSVEGDATSLYISALAKDYGHTIKITRLAKGLPTGSDIRYADEITLGQAIIERKEI